jgi:hypothetical protein
VALMAALGFAAGAGVAACGEDREGSVTFENGTGTGATETAGTGTTGAAETGTAGTGTAP